MKKIAVHLARHRRLLALGGLSLSLHLLALAWIGGRLDADEPGAAGVPIALRLEHAAGAAAPATQAADPAPLPGAPQPAAPSAARAGAAEAETAADTAVDTAAAERTSELPPLQPLAPASTARSSGAPERPAALPVPPSAAAAAPTRGVAARQMPGRYLVRMPPSSHLRYALSRTSPGGASTPAGEAQLVWEAGGGRYQLRLEGVLGLLESEGGGDDAGIAPRLASEHQEDGSDRVTRFDRAGGRIEAEGGRSDPLYLGSQDRASLFMQLAGMGLAEPEQMQGVIELVVGGPQGARVVRFQVLGREQLATGAGPLATLRLAELSEPGTPTLEFWLAPAHNWMPVQLRVTAPDGSSANQVLIGTGSGTGSGQEAQLPVM